MAEKCKPCKIYRRMCDVYGKQCFIKKMFKNGINYEPELKRQLMDWKHTWPSGKEKVPVTAVSKEVYADTRLGQERTDPSLFL